MEIKDKISEYETPALKDAASAMFNDCRDSIIMALYLAMEELKRRLPESEYVEFCTALEKNTAYFSCYDSEGLPVYKNFKL